MHYRPDSQSPNLSVRTNYSQRKNKINRVKTPSSNKRINYNLNENNYYKANNINNDNDIYNYESINKKPYLNNSNWTGMLIKASKDEQDHIKRKPNNYQSNVLSRDYYDNNGEKRHFKESSNYDYSTKTQITTLPGGVKRNKYEIKDDLYIRKPYNESRLYKMVRDYNCDISYEKDYDPITQGYNVNSFPTKQRFLGSFQRIKDHDIFNTNFQNENHKNIYNYRFCGK